MKGIEKVNIKQLEEKLEEIGINKADYNLGNRPIRAFELGIKKEEKRWEVFQATERGDVNIIESFDNEENACELVLDYLAMRKKRKERRAQGTEVE